MNWMNRVYRGAVAGVALAAVYGQAAPLHFYKLGNSLFNSDQAILLARNYGLTAVQPIGAGPTGIYQMGDGSVRFSFTGGVFHLQPTLVGLKGAPLSLPAVQKLAPAYLSKFRLIPKGTNVELGNSFVWSSCPGTTKGHGTTQDLLRTQHYYPVLDGLPVVGPRSVLSVTADSQGITGMEDTLLPAVQQPDDVVLKTANQADLEFGMQARLHYARGKYSLQGRRLVYFEQGLNYIQPAYLYDTLFTDTNGNQTGDSIVVPLAQNSPEAIRDGHDDTVVPPIFPNSGAPTAELDYLDRIFASTARMQSPPLIVGQYIVREDSSYWLADAQAFWSQITGAQSITPWNPSITRRDYWWDEPWCWEAALGIPDNSPYFVNQDNLVQIEGHGAPWEITTYKNYGDIIHLNQIAGYGANRLSGQTAWCIWQSCDVIPAPGDPYGGDYTSGSPFDVWWNIFKGMRGNFGYHTTMGIANGVGNMYGFQIGLGFPMVSTWLNCTANNPQGHPSGWNYGSCVVVSGHENDTVYDFSGIPNPGSLTIYWIHP